MKTRRISTPLLMVTALAGLLILCGCGGSDSSGPGPVASPPVVNPPPPTPPPTPVPQPVPTPPAPVPQPPPPTPTPVPQPTPPATPTASFKVTSSARGADACQLSGTGSSDIDCSFDGSASTGNGGVKSWRWTITVGSQSRTQDSTQAITRPEAGCGFLGGVTPTQDGSVQFIQMIVRLVVTDSRGVESSATTNNNIRLFPNKNCYGF